MTATTSEANLAGDGLPPNHRLAFISYSRRDGDFVLRLASDLERRGVGCWLDKSGLEPGSPDWEQAIRDAIRSCQAVLLIASPSSRQSKYVADEVGIAQMYGRRVYPLWAEGDEWLDSIRLGMGSVQYLDARGEAYAAAVDALVAELQREQGDDNLRRPAGGEPDFTPRNPYKGLNPFTGADAGDFFGREADLTQLVQTLAQTLQPGPDGSGRLLAVAGASGSGKSSLVMAGLVPTLLRGALPGSEGWRFLGERRDDAGNRTVTPMVPGSQPVEALALALASSLPDRSVASIREDLDDDTCRGLHRLMGMLAQSPEQRAVLLIDQFEELFTQTADPRERQHFIGLLLAAATVSRGPTLIILTVRADFYHHLMEFADLWRIVQPRTWYVTRLSVDELREVVEAPARLPDTQLSYDGDLVGDMLFEVREREAALPLVQFTLDQLFQHRRGHHLTLEAYREIGGVTGALGRHADDVYSGLPSDTHRRLARELFLLLVRAGGGEDRPTRRRLVGGLTLATPDDTETMRIVAEAFVQARLLTAGTYDQQPTLELSHEALIQSWQRLQAWLKEDPEGQRIQDELIERAEQWDHHARDRGALYGGQLLQEVQQWRTRRNPALGALERDFLAASEAEEQRVRRERLRRRRVLQSIGSAGVAIVVVLALLALFAAYQARVSARTAVARELAASATSQLQVDPHWSLELAIEAYQICQSPPYLALPLASLRLPLPFAGACEHPSNPQDRQVEQTLRQAVAASHLLNTLDTGGTPLATYNGLGLVAGRLPDNRVQIWDATLAKNLPPLAGHSAQINAAVFSADGRLLATGSDDGTALIWDLHSAGQPALLAKATAGCPVIDVQLWRDRLATVCRAGIARVWSLPASGAGGDPGPATALFTITVPEPASDHITGAAFAPNDGRLALVTNGGLALIVDPTGKQVGNFAAAQGAINPPLQVAAFSQDGTLLLTAGTDSNARVLDATTGALKSLLVGGHTAGIRAAAFSPDGAWIVTGSYDDTARVWPLSAGLLRVAAVLRGDSEPLTSVAFAGGSPGAGPAEDRIVTTSEDGTARVWEWGYSAGVRYPLSGVFGDMQRPPGTAVNALYLTRDGNDTAVAWDYPNAQDVRMGQLGPDGSAAAIRATPDGTLITVARDGMVRLWSRQVRAQLAANLGAPLPPERGFGGGVSLPAAVPGTCRPPARPVSVAVSGDGETLAVGGPDGNVRIWNLRGDLLNTLSMPAAECPVTEVQLGAHGFPAAAVSADGSAQIWRRSDDGTIAAVELKPAAGRSIDFLALSPDGRSLYTGNSDGSVSQWNADGTLRVRELHLNLGPPQVVFSIDGSRLLAADASEPMLWDPLDAGEHAEAASQFGVPSTQWIWVAFSDDGRWAVTTHTDGSVRIWDSSSNTGAAAAVINGHDGPSVASISADGRLVLTAGLDGTVRAYTCVFCGPIGAVWQVALDRAKAQSLTRPQQQFLAQRR